MRATDPTCVCRGIFFSRAHTCQVRWLHSESAFFPFFSTNPTLLHIRLTLKWVSLSKPRIPVLPERRSLKRTAWLLLLWRGVMLLFPAALPPSPLIPLVLESPPLHLHKHKGHGTRCSKESPANGSRQWGRCCTSTRSPEKPVSSPTADGRGAGSRV